MTEQAAATATEENPAETQATQQKPAEQATQSAPSTAAAEALEQRLKAAEDRAKQAEEKLSEREKQDLSAQQRAEKERDDARKRADELQTEVRTSRVQLAAIKLSVRPEAVEDVAKLLDWSTVSDPDDAKQVEKAVRALLEKRPYLVGVESADGGGGRNGAATAGNDMNQLLRRAAGRA